MRRRIMLQCIKGMSIFLAAVPFEVYWQLQYPFASSERIWLLAGIVLFAWMYRFFGQAYNAFSVSQHQIPELIFSQTLAVFMADMSMYLARTIMEHRFSNILSLGVMFLFQWMLVALWGVVGRKCFFRFAPAKHTAILGPALNLSDQDIQKYAEDMHIQLCAHMDTAQCVHELERLDALDLVMLGEMAEESHNTIMRYCLCHGIDLCLVPRVEDVLICGAKFLNVRTMPVLYVEKYCPAFTYVVAKRFFDLVVSGIGLLILSPMFLAITVAILLEGRGPVFYTQTRLTKNGKRFKIYKFRSMTLEEEQDAPKVTCVGGFLRKYHLDELPQLINILRGEMSVVGPRPERPEIAAEYEKELPEFCLRLQANAGLTGYAQINGRYDSTPSEKLQMDLMYLANPSIWEDIKICISTVKNVLRPVTVYSELNESGCIIRR